MARLVLVVELVEVLVELELDVVLDPPRDVVVDPAARLYGGEFLTMRIATERQTHPILGPLDAPPLFSLTRSVETLEGDGTTASVTFLRTSEQSWATRDASVIRTGASPFVAGRDRPGPVSVGVETAFQVVTPPGAEPRQGRLVVFGNSEFANNFFIQFLGNKDLFVNSVAWLAREPEAISHRPRRKELGVQQFYVSAEQGDAAFWGTVVVEPALFAAVGLALALRRRWRRG